MQENVAPLGSAWQAMHLSVVALHSCQATTASFTSRKESSSFGAGHWLITPTSLKNCLGDPAIDLIEE